MDADDFAFTLDNADADAPTDDRERLLRRSLQLDAAASGALGVLLAAGGAVLDGPLGIPAAVAGGGPPPPPGPVLGAARAPAAPLWADLQLPGLRGPRRPAA